MLIKMSIGISQTPIKPQCRLVHLLTFGETFNLHVKITKTFVTLSQIMHISLWIGM